MAHLWTDDTADTITLNGRKLTAVPGLERCTNAVRLWLSANRLRAVPPGVAEMRALRVLDLRHNPIEVLDDALAARLSLHSILLDETRLESLPPAVRAWPLVEVRLPSLPATFAWRASLARIDHARLASLTLTGNPGVAEVVDLLPRFTQLKVLHLGRCGIARVPETFAAFTQLETLSLGENDLAELPEAVVTLPALRSLVIAKNPGTRRIKAALKKRGVPYVVS